MPDREQWPRAWRDYGEQKGQSRHRNGLSRHGKGVSRHEIVNLATERGFLAIVRRAQKCRFRGENRINGLSGGGACRDQTAEGSKIIWRVRIVAGTATTTLSGAFHRQERRAIIRGTSVHRLEDQPGSVCTSVLERLRSVSWSVGQYVSERTWSVGDRTLERLAVEISAQRWPPASLPARIVAGTATTT